MLVTLFLNELLELICLRTVHWFQVFLSNNNNSIYQATGTTTTVQSGPGSNACESNLQILQSSWSEALPSDNLVSYPVHSLPGWRLISVQRGCPRGVMAKAFDCGIVVSEFELQSHYYVPFRTNTLGKGMNRVILPAMG